MRKRLPQNSCDKITSMQIGLISFGIGIFVAFFLTAKVLAIIEAFLLIAAGSLFMHGK